MEKTIGVILIVLGLLGFAVDSIPLAQGEEVPDVGPVEVEREEPEREEPESLPITPVAAEGAVVVGVALVVAGAWENK